MILILYNFWKQIKNNKIELYDELKNIKNINKEDFQEYRNEIMNLNNDMLKQAKLYFIINRCSFSGATLSGGFSKGAPFGSWVSENPGCTLSNIIILGPCKIL